MILIIYAHPYPQHSHANKRMLEQAGTLEGVEIRGNDSNLLIVFYVQIVPDDFVMQLHRF